MPWEKFQYCETDTTFPSKIFIMDEYAAFMDIPDRDIEMRKARSQVETNLKQIARLGRSQHIHLILCTQTMTRDLFDIDLRNNIGHRICCGAVQDTISQMIMDSSEGTTIPPRKGACLSWTLHETKQFQSYFIPNSDEVLAYGTLKEASQTQEEDENIEVEPEKEEEKPENTVSVQENENKAPEMSVLAQHEQIDDKAKENALESLIKPQKEEIKPQKQETPTSTTTEPQKLVFKVAKKQNTKQDTQENKEVATHKVRLTLKQ